MPDHLIFLTLSDFVIRLLGELVLQSYITGEVLPVIGGYSGG